MGTRAEAASEGHPRRPPPALSPAAGPRRWTCASEVTSWDVAPPRALGESRPQTGSARDPPAEPAAPRATGVSSPGPPARAPHAGWLKRRGCVVPWPGGSTWEATESQGRAPRRRRDRCAPGLSAPAGSAAGSSVTDRPVPRAPPPCVSVSRRPTFIRTPGTSDGPALLPVRPHLTYVDGDPIFH